MRNSNNHNFIHHHGYSLTLFIKRTSYFKMNEKGNKEDEKTEDDKKKGEGFIVMCKAMCTVWRVRSG